MHTEWLEQAILAVKNGLCEKLEKGNVIVYKCGKIIRIDIKNVFGEDQKNG